jgi:histidyl-tRNA synthetase
VSYERLALNPLRILDSKDAGDQALVADAPKIDQFFSKETGEFFEAVTKGLDAAGVAWTRNPALVRGLDYYRHTAFEFITDRLGAQGTVLGGGRYDGLMQSLGGAPTPAVGWAAGIERLAMLVGTSEDDWADVALVIEEEGLEAFAAKAMRALREESLSAELFDTGSIRKRFDKASKSGASIIYVVRRQDGELVGQAKGHDQGLFDSVTRVMTALLSEADR